MKESPQLIQRHNQPLLDAYLGDGGVVMGPYASYTWRRDPRHLLFSMARYKFVAKMLSGKKDALEIGCGDAFAMPLVLQEVGRIHGIDLESAIIEDDRRRFANEPRLSFEALDITERPASRKLDCAYSLDVIEHIPPAKEARFMENLCLSLKPGAVCLIGTPNVTAHSYASPNSATGHINLKSGDELRDLMRQYFENVFLYCMNDEMIHTGFTPMGHFLFAMGVGVRPSMACREAGQ